MNTNQQNPRTTMRLKPEGVGAAAGFSLDREIYSRCSTNLSPAHKSQIWETKPTPGPTG
jgi:hypothetical protein